MARILVWSDYEDAGVLIKRVLEMRGHDIRIFKQGDEAFKYLRLNRADLVILDVNLRATDGVNRLKTIKNKAISVPVILCTACPTHTMEELSIQMGVHAFWKKPMENADLGNKAGRALARLSKCSKPSGTTGFHIKLKGPRFTGNISDSVSW